MESKVSIPQTDDEEKNMKIAFHFIATFLQSFSKIERSRCMILWNTEYVISGLSNSSKEFSKQLMNHSATLAMVPDVEQNSWTETSMKETLSTLKPFEVSNFTYNAGTGWVNLKLSSTYLQENNLVSNDAMICLKFVKRIERSNSIYLVDNEHHGINGKHFVRTKIFTFHFLRPKKVHNQLKRNGPKKRRPKTKKIPISSLE